MYSKQQASLLKQSFWTAFGRYMAPVPGADGNKINWINYKTGVKHFYFRMDVTNQQASIAIVVTGIEEPTQQSNFQKLIQLQPVLREKVGEVWDLQESVTDDHGRKIALVIKSVKGVNVFDEASWPAIISFFKPRLIALDAFWCEVKDLFE